jgi:intracellular multiplication protein IcmP
MAGQQQQSQGGSADNALDLFWGIALIVVGFLLVWFFAKEYIIAGVFYIRQFEILLIQAVLDGWSKLANLFHLPVATVQTNLKELSTISNYIQQTHKEAVTFQDLINISAVTGSYIRYPLAVLSLILGFLLYFSHLTLKFQNNFNMQGLKNEEQKIWPAIGPVVKLDLVKQDINEGPWAMAMSPLQFAKKYELMSVSTIHNKAILKPLKGASHRIFALQLGSLWTSPKALPMHTQALFAIFAARANRDREGSTKLLSQISLSAKTGKLDFTGTQELLKKHWDCKYVQMVLSRHAYILTIMASMLDMARTDGVLATAEFLWLKPIDRRLWYILNSVGRQTAVPEIAGPFAHWLAEKTVGMPLKVPMVDMAVEAFEMGLEEILYEPEDTLRP